MNSFMVAFSTERTSYLPQFLGNIVYCSDGFSLHLQDCICEDTAAGGLGYTRCTGDAGSTWISCSPADLTWTRSN